MPCISANPARFGFAALLRVPLPITNPSLPFMRKRVPIPMVSSRGSFLTGFISPHPDTLAPVRSGQKPIAWKMLSTVLGEQFTNAE